MNCIQKDADGICAKLSDDTCRQPCIEGPCTHEVMGEMTTAYDDDGLPYLVSADGSEARHIVELLTAEAEGRLVVLPCKAGDTVYELSCHNKCQECQDNYVQRCKLHTGECDRTDEWKIYEIPFCYDCYSLHTRNLFRGIYLTRAEAEAALTKMEGTL